MIVLPFVLLVPFWAEYHHLVVWLRGAHLYFRRAVICNYGVRSSSSSNCTFEIPAEITNFLTWQKEGAPLIAILFHFPRSFGPWWMEQAFSKSFWLFFWLDKKLSVSFQERRLKSREIRACCPGSGELSSFSFPPLWKGKTKPLSNGINLNSLQKPKPPWRVTDCLQAPAQSLAGLKQRQKLLGCGWSFKQGKIPLNSLGIWGLSFGPWTGKAGKTALSGGCMSLLPSCLLLERMSCCL